MKNELIPRHSLSAFELFEHVVYPLFSAIEENPLRFWAYDIMIGGELITGVPQEFLDSWNEDENGD